MKILEQAYFNVFTRESEVRVRQAAARDKTPRSASEVFMNDLPFYCRTKGKLPFKHH
jgi:hypothetical protein